MRTEASGIRGSQVQVLRRPKSKMPEGEGAAAVKGYLQCAGDRTETTKHDIPVSCIAKHLFQDDIDVRIPICVVVCCFHSLNSSIHFKDKRLR